LPWNPLERKIWAFLGFCTCMSILQGLPACGGGVKMWSRHFTPAVAACSKLSGLDIILVSGIFGLNDHRCTHFWWLRTGVIQDFSISFNILQEKFFIPQNFRASREKKGHWPQIPLIYTNKLVWFNLICQCFSKRIKSIHEPIYLQQRASS
jgi:hypothetical protein